MIARDALLSETKFRIGGRPEKGRVGVFKGVGLPTVFQAVFWRARAGLKRVPDLRMAQATLRRRLATER